MPIEYEAKILDIDPAAMAAKITAAGGVHRKDALLRRFVYDITPGDLTQWVRLRDNGTNCTLAVKQIAHDGIDGTHETETTVGDFDTANRLLGLLGYAPKGYQENRRSSYLLGAVRLEIDSWPRIPVYLEIEGDTADEVTRTADLLGYGPADLNSENTTKVYARYGIDLSTVSDLRFELSGCCCAPWLLGCGNVVSASAGVPAGA